MGRLLFVNLITPRVCSTRKFIRGRYFLNTSKKGYSVNQGTSTSLRTCHLPPMSCSLFGQKSWMGSVLLEFARMMSSNPPPPNTHPGGLEENDSSTKFEANKFEVIERLEKEISLVHQQLSTLEG